jgi:hypothetical protein
VRAQSCNYLFRRVHTTYFSIGVVAGLVGSQPDLALLYMDGGLDAVTLAAYRLGGLDSTGMAHLVAEPGSEPMLSQIGPRYPQGHHRG